jgi:DNA-binding NarL/FixJ family response regulator
MKANIVIIDDHEVIRYGLAISLASSATAFPQMELAIVGQASFGKEVFDILNTVTVNVLLMDILLPDINGLDLVKQLRSRGYGHNLLHILVMTELDGFNIKSVFDSGADGYISKDEQISVFLEAIQSILAHPGTPWVHPKTAKHMVRVEYSLKAAGFTETEIILLLHHINLPTPEIAERMNISIKTVRNHLSNIYDKINVNSRHQAIDFAAKIGLLGR